VPGGRRDALRQHLADARIGTEIYYPLGLHAQECFQHYGVTDADLPETARAAEEVLALPIFPELTAEQQQRLVASVGQFFGVSAEHSIPKPKYLDRCRVPHA